MYILISDESIWLKKEAWTNPLSRLTRRVKEWAFDDYGSAMENLRQIDSEIHEWAETLRHFLKQAKQAKQQGRHLDVITWLNEINQRLRFISSSGKSISDLRDEQIKDFYTQHEETPVNPHEHIAQAGLMDDAKRWLANRQLREQYGKRVKLQRNAIEKLFSLCERTINGVEGHIDAMEEFRNVGDIESYIEKLGKVSELQKKFEVEFLSVFDTYFAEDVAKLLATKSNKQHQSITNPTIETSALEPTLEPAAPAEPVAPVEPPPAEPTEPAVPVEEVTVEPTKPSIKAKKKKIKTILPSSEQLSALPKENLVQIDPLNKSIEAQFLQDLAKTSDVKEFAMKLIAMGEVEEDLHKSIEMLIIAERLLED